MNEAARQLGRLGGLVRSEAKARAARLNGAKRKLAHEPVRIDTKQVTELRAKLDSIPRGGLGNEVIRDRIIAQLRALGVSE